MYALLVDYSKLVFHKFTVDNNNAYRILNNFPMPFYCVYLNVCNKVFTIINIITTIYYCVFSFQEYISVFHLLLPINLNTCCSFAPVF